MNESQSNAQPEQADELAKETAGRTDDQVMGGTHSKEKRKLRRAIDKAELDLGSFDNSPNNNL